MSGKKDVSRRGFIRAATGGAGAAALGGLVAAPKAAANGETASDRPWDRECDVVVVGYGGAGAAAAITAHDAGARVLILEKGGEGGGSTYYSGGFFVSPREAAGAVDYLMDCARAGDGHHFDIDRDDLTAWAQEAVQNEPWFRSLGGDAFVSLRGWYADAPGADAYTSWQPRENPTGIGLWQVLSKAVEERGIEIAYNAPAARLVTRADADDGAPVEVLGVIAAGADGPVAIKADRAVVLTCGGFDYNETLKKSYLRSYPQYSTGHPGNTGDAVTLAAGAGAALWRLTGTSANLCHKLPDVPVAFPSQLQLGAMSLSMVLVNRQGRRFVNEALNYDAVAKSLDNFDAGSRAFQNNPCWCVFDEKTRVKTPAGLSVPIGNPVHHWSADNSAEIDKGWIVRADTVAGLAGLLEIEPSVLEATISAYNDHCARGSDPDFGRALGLIPLDQPPYYALKGYPGLWATGGGPRIDRQARVIDVAGRAVPRLYVAGSASSFCFSHLYPLSGTAIGDCIAMGRIAGRNASALEGW